MPIKTYGKKHHKNVFNCLCLFHAFLNIKITKGGRTEFCIFIGCGILAVLLIAVLLEEINLKEQKNEGEANLSTWKTLLSTLYQLKDIRQCLLIPLTMFSGFQQGFLSSDYTKVKIVIFFIDVWWIYVGTVRCY